MKTIKKLGLALGITMPVMAVAFVLMPSQGHVSADETPDAISYMQVYSAGGTYTRAKITINPSNQAATHKCGGTFGSQAGNASNELSIKLYKSRPHKIRCDAVGSGTTYSVKFLKGKKTAATAGDYKDLPGSHFSALDVDNNTTKPYKSCMTLHPTATSTPTSVNGTCVGSPDTIPKDNGTLSFQLRATTNVKASNGPSGIVRLTDTGPWDGTAFVSRPFCTGSINVTYQRTDIGGQPVSSAYGKKLRFKNGACEAKLTNDRATFSRKSTYQITASYPGNTYFNAPSNATQSFTTR